MEDGTLHFPDIPRLELERSIGDLIAQAQRVLTAQGRLRRLLNAYQTVSLGLDTDLVLTRIVEAAVALVEARYGALAIINEHGRLDRFIHVGVDEDVVRRIGRYPEGKGLLGAVIGSGRPVRLAHISDDPRAVGFPEHHPPMDAFLGVPIKARGRLMGILYLTDPSGGEFSLDDEELVESLAATAGIAIENATLYEAARRQERLSTAMSEVTAALLSHDPGEDALGVVAERLASVVRAECLLVVVPASDSEMLRIDVARGLGADELTGLRYPRGSSLVARAIATGTPVTGTDPDFAHALGDGMRLGPTAALPLMVDGAPVAALCVARETDGEPFTEADLATVSDFANRAGIAISLAWARRDRQRLELIEDRGRIARDLHDHVIQRLFATGLSLQALAAAHPAVAADLDAQITGIDAAISDIRTAVFALRPRRGAPSLRQRILDVIGDFSPTPRITFGGPIDFIATDRLADDVVAVVRECLANVSRHAHADTAWVQVTASDTDVTVLVEDDGVGVEAGDHRVGGTANLAERAAAHGGAFTIGPREDGGTSARWTARLPGEGEGGSAGGPS